METEGLWNSTSDWKGCSSARCGSGKFARRPLDDRATSFNRRCSTLHLTRQTFGCCKWWSLRLWNVSHHAECFCCGRTSGNGKNINTHTQRWQWDVSPRRARYNSLVHPLSPVPGAFKAFCFLRFLLLSQVSPSTPSSELMDFPRLSTGSCFS